MKKTLLILSCLIISSTAIHAQLKKGSILLGGDLGFSASKTEEDISTDSERKLSNISLRPSVAIAVKDNLFVGVNLNYSGQKDKNESMDYDVTTRQYGLGFFARKYKELGSSGFFVFGQAGINYLYLKSDNGRDQVTEATWVKRHDVQLYLQPGISYAVSKRFQLETGLNNLLSIGYYTEKNRQGRGGFPVDYTEGRVSGFSANTAFSNTATPFYFGFRLLLQK